MSSSPLPPPASCASPPPAPARCWSRRGSCWRAPRPSAASSSSSSAAPPTASTSSCPTPIPAYARLRGALAIDVAAATQARRHCSRCIRRWSRSRKLYRGEAGAVRPRGRVAVSRPLALRRPERARDRAASRRTSVKDGWLNRLVGAAAAPRAARRSRSRRPCRWRCAAPAEVTSYAPSALPQAPDDLLQRVAAALRRTTRSCTPLWAAAMDARGMAGDAAARRTRPSSASSRRASWRSPTARASRCSRPAAGTRTARRRSAWPTS